MMLSSNYRTYEVADDGTMSRVYPKERADTLQRRALEAHREYLLRELEVLDEKIFLNDLELLSRSESNANSRVVKTSQVCNNCGFSGYGYALNQNITSYLGVPIYSKISCVKCDIGQFILKCSLCEQSEPLKIAISYTSTMDSGRCIRCIVKKRARNVNHIANFSIKYQKSAKAVHLNTYFMKCPNGCSVQIANIGAPFEISGQKVGYYVKCPNCIYVNIVQHCVNCDATTPIVFPHSTGDKCMICKLFPSTSSTS